MVKQLSDKRFLFLCQSANWQSVVCADDEETAATEAIEEIMLSPDSQKEDKFSLSMAIVIKKLPFDLMHPELDEDCVTFYCPAILANAGFHNEAANLHKYLEKEINKEDDKNE